MCGIFGLVHTAALAAAGRSIIANACGAKTLAIAAPIHEFETTSSASSLIEFGYNICIHL